jgi:adenine-specific DNA-methyltransferase
MTPLLTAGDNYVYHMDALRLLRMLPDSSVDLALTDPPFNVGKADWDSWSTVQGYLDWLDMHLAQFRRVLKPNGSLYLFCATKYAAKVELTVEKHFNVLNNIRWRKPAYSTKAEMFDKETMRAYFPASESIIFAEQWGADRPYSDALIDGNATYWQALEGAKTSIFGDYLKVEFDRAGATNREIAALFPSRTGGLTGCVSNWLLGLNVPTPEQYRKMRDYLNRNGDYAYLRREYEDLRRPFFGSEHRPYTDVWEYPTVNTYPGKHPCEKPLDMLRDMIATSSRESDVVLDPFAGSGNTGRAAIELKRRFIGCDTDSYWARRANSNLFLPYTLPLFQEAS